MKEAQGLLPYVLIMLWRNKDDVTVAKNMAIKILLQKLCRKTDENLKKSRVICHVMFIFKNLA